MKNIFIPIFALASCSVALAQKAKDTKAPVADPAPVVKAEYHNPKSKMAVDGTIPEFTEWDVHPKMHPVPPKYNDQHAICLLQSVKIDYKLEGGDVTKYSTFHRIIKVLDNYGINDYNEIEVPFQMNHTRVDSIKARTILPDGTTRDVSYKMVYISGGSSLFFALDGLEKNAEVEIVVKYKEIFQPFNIQYFQFGIPVLNAYYELNYPKEFTFNTKGYHGFPSGTETVVGGHKQVKVYMNDIPALHNQPYSFYDLYRMRIEYSLDHTTSRGGYRHGVDYTYDMRAHFLYKYFYTYKKSEKKSVDAFLTKIGIRGGETSIEKIKKIEDGIKTNIHLYGELAHIEVENSDTIKANLDTILLTNSASSYGMTRLFSACFTQAGVKHELGVTGDRSEHLMDPQFTNWAPLNDYVFYFPKTGGYLTPDQIFYRYPEVPWRMINNYGVFCKTDPETEFNIGKEVTESEADVRLIAPMPASYSKSELAAALNLDADFHTTVDYQHKLSGLRAPELRSEIALATPEERKKIVLEHSLLANLPEMLVKYAIKNEGISEVYENRPIELDMTLKLSGLVEKAGSGYLVKIGKLIGPQKRLDAKEERILPVDIDFPNMNTYKLSMDIPEGYKVSNLEVLNKKCEHFDRNTTEVTAYFKSNYQLNGRRLTVNVTECYTQMHYQVIDFENFKKVINAAADFETASILLEPEKMKPAKKSKTKTVAAAQVNKKK